MTGCTYHGRHRAGPAAGGLLLLLAFAGAVRAQDQPLPVDPYADLTDLWRLTFPMAGSTGQASSYDRTGGNADAIFWYYQRTGPKRVVMADLAGPGCVGRIWVTAFDWNTARIEIFVDNPTVPVVSAPMRDFFGSGALPPFTPPLSMPSTGSWVCNLPIPFQHSCRIEAVDARTDNLCIYYNVTYRTYPPGTVLPEVFQMPPTASQQARISQFAGQWAGRGQDPKGTTPGQQSVTGAPYIAPHGGSAVLASLSGAGVITGIRLSVNPHNWDNERWSRLRIRFDGAAEYAVDSPLAAFFGCGFPTADAQGLPLGTINGQMYCYLPMPYAAGAVVELVNSSSTVISSAPYTITYVPRSAGEIGRYRFHASARSQTPIGGGQPAYRILQTGGRGHYLGCVLSIESLDPGWGPLEGDEQIYVNGEPRPSIHGTGTEDYFNGGFYFLDGPVSWPFSGCSVISQSWPLIMSAYRLQITDAAVFDNGVIVDMEHGGVNEANGNYWSTAWYYRDDGAGPPPPVPANPPRPAGSLVNGDFENGFTAAGEGSGWVGFMSRDLYGRELNVFSPATDQKYSGNTSQRILLRTPHVADLVSGIAQQVPVSRGTTYRVTARLRLGLGSGLSPGHALARLGLGVNGHTYFEDPGVTWVTAPTAPDTWHTVTAQATATTDHLAVFAAGVRPVTWPAGDATLWIDAVTVEPTTGPPLPPSNLAAAAEDGQVRLTWEASAGADSYRVKRSTVSGGPYTTVAEGIAGTSHVDAGLTNGTTYYYVVTAVNAHGESDPSSQASATPGSAPPPGVVAEDFETMPAWSSGYDAAWGGPANWSVVAGGQSGNALQATRSSQGSSARVKVFQLTPSAAYTLSVWIRCPAYTANPWWAECAFKIGTFTAEDLDQNGGSWTMVQKFASDGTNGNGNSWTQYSRPVTVGPSGQLSVGFKLGSSGGAAPAVLWDTLRLTPTVMPPAIGLSPTSLSAVCTEGSNPAAGSFTVANTGGGTLTYSITDDAAWLSCSPSSGTSTGEADSVTVSYAAAGLSPGTYQGTVTVRDPAASNSPQLLPVTLTVQPVLLPIPGDMNADRRVNEQDVAAFLGCVTGAGQGPPGPGCGPGDIDADTDVDQADFGLLQRCLHPPAEPADPACAS